MELLLRPVACYEALRYVVCDLCCNVVCGASMPEAYIPKIVACAYMFNDFICGIIPSEDTQFDFFDSGCTQPALFGSRASLSIFPLLTCATIIGEDWMLCVWSSICTVSQDDAVNAVFVDDE